MGRSLWSRLSRGLGCEGLLPFLLVLILAAFGICNETIMNMTGGNELTKGRTGVMPDPIQQRMMKLTRVVGDSTSTYHQIKRKMPTPLMPFRFNL